MNVYLDNIHHFIMDIFLTVHFACWIVMNIVESGWRHTLFENITDDFVTKFSTISLNLT